jgi:hypothetical protein
VETVWGGRNGYEYRCIACGKHWGKNARWQKREDLPHRDSCRWLAAMKQAEELRAGGVLPPEPAVKATA